jgi:hypothetical protein
VLPRVTVSAPEQDPRCWNRQLADTGTPFGFGAVTHTTAKIPTLYLERLSTAVLTREPPPNLPDSMKRMPGDLIIAISDGDFISFATRVRSGAEVKAVVGIRSHTFYPLSLPNVARTVIAHELGHTLGLRHNDDRTMLMCGRPAPCRPDAFQSDAERLFPLTVHEKTELFTLYPPTWKALR